MEDKESYSPKEVASIVGYSARLLLQREEISLVCRRDEHDDIMRSFHEKLQSYTKEVPQNVQENLKETVDLEGLERLCKALRVI